MQPHDEGSEASQEQYKVIPEDKTVTLGQLSNEPPKEAEVLGTACATSENGFVKPLDQIGQRNTELTQIDFVTLGMFIIGKPQASLDILFGRIHHARWQVTEPSLLTAYP